MKFASILSGLTAAFILSSSGIAGAIQEPAAFAGRPDFELADGTLARAQRDVRWFHAPRVSARAWASFLSKHGPAWHAGWDAATGVPTRIWGEGIAAPGTVANDKAADAFSHAFLAQHLDLLAPGADPADFTLVSNDLDAGMRTVGFIQHHRGIEVVGGQVSFRFKNDRLIMIGSEALPRVRAAIPRHAVSALAAKTVAEKWIETESVTAHAKTVDGPFVLPIVGRAGVREYRVVMRVTVAAQQPIGLYWVYVDAASGAPVAREQRLRFAQGNILYNAPIRYPLSTRMDYPAVNAFQTIDGTQVTSDASGGVTWADGGPGAATATTKGPLFDVLNDEGPEATQDFTLTPGGSYAWNAANVATVDAQLVTFIHAHVVKAYAKSIAPSMGWLNAHTLATVNIDDTCNAFSDGTDINFYKAGGPCENTGRIADVVYHEFGHSFHFHAIIQGVGQFEEALSEGQADYMAATITGDSGTARGFFKSNEPLRELDEPNGEHEHVWPDDVAGDPHETGIIIGGALWDLRKNLIAKLGDTEGHALADHLYYQGIRRAVDIPSMYPEVVAADDDDGNLENGTPNICEINEAFGRHGLRPLSASAPSFGVTPPSQEGFKVSVELLGLYPQCEDDKIDSVTLNWRLRSAGGPGTDVAMTTSAPTTYEGFIPPQPDGEVVNYKVTVARPGAPSLSFPDNPADPMYEFFVGEVTVLYCTDFEQDPNLGGWTHGLTAGSSSQGADDWQWNVPNGDNGSGDPDDAFSGKRVFGNDLGTGMFNGKYQGDKTNFAMSPVVETGSHTNIRLQYRRWLGVEDAFFDKASIYANDLVLWQNLDSQQGDDSKTHHQDREWRFHDVDLTNGVKDGKVQVKWEIASDGGFELGGWTLDDVCIVAWDAPVCGDGVLKGGEVCDNGPGNSDTAADACRSDCHPARCGDGVKDTGEECDDGNASDDDRCMRDCKINPDDSGLALDDAGCGCRAAGGGDVPGWALVAIGAPLALMRRRRRR